MAENRIAFDVGAFRGDKTKALLRQGFSPVISFEPNPVYAAKLRRRFRDSVIIVEKALGAVSGVKKLMICSKHPAISTCNPDWKTGRFSGNEWDREIDVEQTTLDWAIASFGRPDFIKIDVEGYESEVLRGLSQTVRLLSFEFANEFPDLMRKSLKRLSEIGYERFNVKTGEKTDYLLGWVPYQNIIECLAAKPVRTWGDIYAGENNV